MSSNLQTVPALKVVEVEMVTIVPPIAGPEVGFKDSVGIVAFLGVMKMPTGNDVARMERYPPKDTATDVDKELST